MIVGLSFMASCLRTDRAKNSLVDNDENHVLEWDRISSLVKRISFFGRD